MTHTRASFTCPDCDEPLAFTFESTSGVGAHKRGDHYNTTPDSSHYVCFPCGRAWKQRLSGPLTPDVVGDLSFFTCGDHSCGTAMTVTRAPASGSPIGIELTCGNAHRWVVQSKGDGLAIVAMDAPPSGAAAGGEPAGGG